MTTQQMIEALMEEIAERKNYTYDCNKENGYNKLYDKLFPIYLHHVLIWIRNKNFNAKINEEGLLQIDDYKTMLMERELSKPLTEQSEETIEKLYSLIKR